MSRLDALEILLAAIKGGALDGCSAVKHELLASLSNADKAAADILKSLQRDAELH
jgi:hypothetical protein